MGDPLPDDSVIMDDSPSVPGKRSLAGDSDDSAPKLSKVSGSAPPLVVTSGQSVQPSSLDEMVYVTFHIQEKSGARVFNNPKRISDAIVQGPFAKYFQSGEPEVKGSGKTLAVKLCERDLHKIVPPMENLETLGQWAVKCRRVRDLDDEKFVFGTVGPIDRDLDSDVFLQSLSIIQFNRDHPLEKCEVVEAYRLPAKFPRPDDPVKSEQIRLRFRGPLPVRIQCCGMSYQVSPYHFPVWRCFTCQRFGHGSATCRNSVRCTMCSGLHKFRAPDGSRCDRLPFCYLCQGAHRPVSHLCPVFRDATDIHKKGVAEGIPRREVNDRLRALPSQYRAGARSSVANAPSASAGAPSSVAPRGQPPPLRGWSRPPPRPPSVAPVTPVSNRYSPLCPAAGSGDVGDVDVSAPVGRLPVTSVPSSYADVVVHTPRSPRPRLLRASRPPPRSAVDWAIEEEIVEVPDQEESGPVPPSPLRRPSLRRGASVRSSPPDFDFSQLIHILLDALSSYLAGVSPQDICEQLMPRILGILPSS